jgi:peptidoglycan/xylan/chitin deacetylase (PgdA/CDA1 family)
MGWEQLRALRDGGQEIGAHGWTHTLLTHCDEKQLRTELGGARKALEDGLGAAVTTMSLPGGRYNKRVMAACAEAGYTQVYTSIPKAEPEPAGAAVGRLNVRGDMTLEWIEGLLKPGSTVLSGLERQYKVKAAAKAMLGDRMYEKVWALLNRKEQDAGMGDTAAG